VKYVVEVVRDFAPIEPLTLNLRSCIGTVVYRNRLLPVFECGDLTPVTSQNQAANAPQSIVKLDVNGTLLCLSMYRNRRAAQFPQKIKKIWSLLALQRGELAP
jgi:hypothetical protein